MTALKASTPVSRRPGTRGNPWWNGELERSRRAVNRARERAQGERDQVRRRELQEEFKTKRRDYKKRIKEAKINDLREALEEADPQDPWGLAHRIISRKRKTTTWETVQDERGDWTMGRRDTAAALIRKYFPGDDAGANSQENTTCRNSVARWEEEDDRRITRSELAETVRRRPKRKAPGIDGFPVQGLEPLLQEAGGKFVSILNVCLQEGVFPRVWKQASIAWIPKPGGSGLRPICLLPTIGKVLDKILAARLAHHLERTGRMNAAQFGFRRGRGTTEAIRRVVQGMRRAKEERKHCLLVALDIKNAFNSAWYPKVRQQLEKVRCPGNLGRAISSFLQERTVTSEGVTVQTERGCPQGSCLGPILWLLVMEEWFEEMAQIVTHQATEVDVQAFADDQLVRITAPSVRRTEEAWSRAWEACKKWADNNKLEYAPQKTTAIFAAARGTVREPRIRMGETVVRPKFSMKYLGVMLDRKLLWVDQAVYLRGRVTAAAHRVRAVAGKRWGTRPAVMREIYLRAIRPALLYGAEVWGERWNDSRLRRHLTAAQRPFLLGVSRAYRTTSNAAVQVLAGCIPLHLEARSRYRKAERWFGAGSEGAIRPEREPHPAEPRRAWRELERADEEGAGAWAFTDASASDGATSIGIVIRREGGQVETQGKRLQAGYPVHAAELYAVWQALRTLAEPDREPTRTLHLVTDSRTALGMICGRKGGAAQEVDWRLRQLEEAGTTVRLWWNNGGSEGLRAADEMAKRTRRNDAAEVVTAWTTKRMLTQEAKEAAMETWQEEWTATDKGRLTFSVCPQVEEKLRGWSPDAICLLTGHGPFRAYFRRFNLKEGAADCDCGDGDDTGEHALRTCTLVARVQAREVFRRGQGRRGRPYPFTVSPETTTEEVEAFNRMAEAMILEERDTEDEQEEEEEEAGE